MKESFVTLLIVPIAYDGQAESGFRYALIRKTTYLEPQIGQIHGHAQGNKDGTEVLDILTAANNTRRMENRYYADENIIRVRDVIHRDVLINRPEVTEDVAAIVLTSTAFLTPGYDVDEYAPRLGSYLGGTFRRFLHQE